MQASNLEIRESSTTGNHRHKNGANKEGLSSRLDLADALINITYLGEAGGVSAKASLTFFEFFEGTLLLCVSQPSVNTDFEKIVGN